jgi:hypothetical protein
VDEDEPNGLGLDAASQDPMQRVDSYRRLARDQARDVTQCTATLRT